MSKIQLIETALLSINGARFQDFCNSYFTWKGYDFLSATGSVIGKEKARKGTPDCYIPINENEYIFIEYTTKDRLGESKSFYEKLSKDIDHCFDESKSKIKNDQISKVILCFTQKLKVDEHNSLRKKCSDKAAEFEPYGIDQLAREILRYPSLGRDFLDIPIDTEQILTPTDFIKEYEKGRLSTRLSNKIYFREEEISETLSKLQKTNLIIIEGKPGVGKSRFALEVLSQFCTNYSTYTPVCIDNKDCPIYEDVRVYLHKDNDYIILVDDANRATKHYEFLINLLKEERKGSIKIIATVRDYATRIIEGASRNFDFFKVKIKPLTDKQIQAILKSDDFNIVNQDYLDVIIQVAQGNPRLAIMAAKVALEKQDLSAFDEIPKIYDSYYSEVIDEIDSLKDITFLKVLGIISFFKIINREYQSSDKILEIFEITESDFWEKVITLHKMELVDLFENEVVKISDQILGSYFFYRTFIRDGILDFHALVVNFYESNRGRFKDMIYPAINVFRLEHIENKLNQSLNKTWEVFKDEEDKLLDFLSLFWILQQGKTLNYLGGQIAQLPQNDTEEYIFDKKNDSFVWDSNDRGYLGILKDFLDYPSNNYELALDLTFFYLEKFPSNLAEFIHYVKKRLSFDKLDYQTNFYRQTTLFDKLIEAIKEGKNPELFRGIFYHITNTFLQTAFQKTGSLGRDRSFQMYTFPIPDTPTIKDFRKKIWKFLFEEFLLNRKAVVKAIEIYITAGNLAERDINHKRIIWEYDAQYILPFIGENFDNHDYKEVKIVQYYLEKLKVLNINFDENLKSFFLNNQYELSLKLDQNLIRGKDKYELARTSQFEDDNGQTDFKALEHQKYEELKTYTQDYTLEDYKKLYQNLTELYEIEGNRDGWSLNSSFSQILIILIAKDVDKFLNLLEFVFDSSGFSNSFSNQYHSILTKKTLKQLSGNARKFYDIICKYKSRDTLVWKVSFFMSLEKHSIDAYYSKELIKCIEEINGHFSIYNFDFLSHYQYKPNFIEKIKSFFSKRIKEENKNIYTKVVAILLKKNQTGKSEIDFGNNLISKHNAHFEDIDTLKQIYFANYRKNLHYDFNGKEMKTLCELDSSFIIDFMQEFHNLENPSSNKDLPRHVFISLWKSDFHTEIIDNLMLFFRGQHQILPDWEHPANKFFVATNSEQINKRLDYIKSYIERKAEDLEAIRLIFNIINYSFSNKRLEFLKSLFQYNQNLEFFESLILHTNGVYSGSRIPIIVNRIAFLNQVEEMIKSLPDSSNFIQHQLIIRNKISDYKNEIESVKRRDFIHYFNE